MDLENAKAIIKSLIVSSSLKEIRVSSLNQESVITIVHPVSGGGIHYFFEIIDAGIGLARAYRFCANAEINNYEWLNMGLRQLPDVVQLEKEFFLRPLMIGVTPLKIFVLPAITSV
jgi:hypothetical protein